MKADESSFHILEAFMKNLSIEGARHGVTAFTPLASNAFGPVVWQLSSLRLYPQMVETKLSKPYASS